MFKTRVKHGNYALEDRDRKAPGRKKRLIISMLIGVAVGLWLATEITAIGLNYHSALGNSLFSIGSIKIYAPYKYWQWITQLINAYGLENKQVYEYFVIGIFLQIIGLFGPAIVIKAQLKGLKARSLVEKMQGSARWADKEDIIESSLLPQPGQKSAGVYVGAWEDKKTKRLMYLRHNGPEHVLAYAPTRSGKGVGLVLPTLLSWPHSAFILDIKGENYALTSNWRKSEAHNNLLKFDPIDTTGTTARYNPLNEIRIGTEYEHADIENMALLLADPDGTASRGNQKHWVDTAGSLIVALIYHLLYMAKYGPAKRTENEDGTETITRDKPFEPTLERLRFMFADAGGGDFKDTLQDIMTYPHMPDYSRGWVDSSGNPTYTHPIAASNANEAYQRPENEAGSVLSTAANTLKLFVDPAIAFNTSNATFKLSDLTMLDNPTSLYVCVPPAQLTRLIPLIRILVTQIVTILASNLDFMDGRAVSQNKQRLLLMLDEFPTLGNMEIFETALAFIAGYGLKAYIIVQDLAQLYKRYTDKESIVSNTHVQVAYAPNKLETAKILSEILGNTTIITEVKSKSVTKGVTTFSTTEQEKQRALLTPNEVMGLKGPLKNKEGLIEEPGDMIIKVSGFPPILGRQILYFKDPEFSRRSKLPMIAESDILLNEEKNRVLIQKRQKLREEVLNTALEQIMPAPNDSGKTTAKAASSEVPRADDSVRVAKANEIPKNMLHFLSSLKNPYESELEQLADAPTSFVIPNTKSFEDVPYNDDELFEGNEDCVYTGDEPETNEPVDIETDAGDDSFYSAFCETNPEYYDESDHEIAV